MQLLSADDAFIFQDIFFWKLFLLRIVTYMYCAYIWNQNGKCIKVNTNKPLFGPVVLEITCDIFMIKLVVSLQNTVNHNSIIYFTTYGQIT